MNAITIPFSTLGPASTPTSTGRHEVVYGMLQIASVRVALPLEALREVIPCPARFSGLPAAAKGLLGAVAVRGKVVPVLDLRLVLDLPAPWEPGQVVVLLRHEGRVLGLLADGVRGLVRRRRDTVLAMGLAGNSEGMLFRSSFEHDDGAGAERVSGVASVLDVAALMRLPGLPLLRDDEASAEAGRTPGAGMAEHRALMLVRCGGIGLAVDVTDVHATLPRVAPEASSLQSRVCRGVIEHAGARLAAVDPLALMALGALPEGEPCEALLLRFERGLVALLVSQVIDIVRVRRTELLPLPPLAVRRPELFRAVLRVAVRGDHLVVAEQALMRHPELLTLAAMNTRKPARAEGDRGAAARGVAAGQAAVGSHASGAAARGDAVITYDIGGEAATRLSQVSEVLLLPADFTRPATAHPAVVGMFAHRGRAVTLVCLERLLGAGSETPKPQPACVLLVSAGSASFGFIARRLCHIDTTVWEQAERSAAAAGSPRGLGLHRVVELGTGPQRRTVPLIDLQARALALMQAEVQAERERQAPDALQPTEATECPREMSSTLPPSAVKQRGEARCA